MATRYIEDMREKNRKGQVTVHEVYDLIDLVKEYGDALLELVPLGGSELFRKNGSQVDPKAVVERVKRTLDNYHSIVREGMSSKRSPSRINNCMIYIKGYIEERSSVSSRHKLPTEDEIVRGTTDLFTRDEKQKTLNALVILGEVNKEDCFYSTKNIEEYPL